MQYVSKLKQVEAFTYEEFGIFYQSTPTVQFMLNAQNITGIEYRGHMILYMPSTISYYAIQMKDNTFLHFYPDMVLVIHENNKFVVCSQSSFMDRYEPLKTPQSNDLVKPVDNIHPYDPQLNGKCFIVSFEKFVDYGVLHNANIVNGMPWSFNFHGAPVSHENDEYYLILSMETSLRFTPQDYLVVNRKDNTITILSKEKMVDEFNKLLAWKYFIGGAK